jgi:hypothetical protein
MDEISDEKKEVFLTICGWIQTWPMKCEYATHPDGRLIGSYSYDRSQNKIWYYPYKDGRFSATYSLEEAYDYNSTTLGNG